MKYLIGFLLTSILVAQTAQFPGALATNSDLLIATNRAQTRTTSSFNATTLTIPVQLGTIFVAPTNVTIDAEIMKICSVAATALTVCTGGRGFDGSTAASHGNATQVLGNINAWYHNAMKAEVIAIETLLGINGSNFVTLAGTNVFTGRQDMSGAASTAPFKSGNTLPATCTVNDLFFKSDATAGENLYGCTATNTWTLEAGGGGSSTPPYTLCASGCSGTIGASPLTVLASTHGQGSNAVGFYWDNSTPAQQVLPTVEQGVSQGDLVITYSGTLSRIVISGLAGGGGGGGGGTTYVAGPSGALSINTVLTPNEIDVTSLVPLKASANTWTGANDFTTASATGPNKSGVSASIPATCSVGQTYFKTDVTAGTNLFGCTAVNTWTALGASSGTTTDYLWFKTASASPGGTPAALIDESTANAGHGTWSGSFMGTALLTAGGTGNIFFTTILPDNWTSTIRLKVLSSLQAGFTGTGTYVMKVQTSCGTPGLFDLSSITYAAAQDISNTLVGTDYKAGKWDTIATLTTSQGPCAAGSLLIVRIQRIPGSGGDTAADSVEIAGIQLAISHN